MSRLLNYFLRGLVLVVPLALTVYVCGLIFVTIDHWLGLPIPGAGFVLALALITLVGFTASSLITRSMIATLDRVFERLPFVRLLYSSTKDMLNAFVGEKRRFDKPVVVSLNDDGSLKVLAFLTSDSLARSASPIACPCTCRSRTGSPGIFSSCPRAGSSESKPMRRT